MKPAFRLDERSAQRLRARAQRTGRTPSGEACAIVVSVLGQCPLPARDEFVALMESNRLLAQWQREQRAVPESFVREHIGRVDAVLAAARARL